MPLQETILKLAQINPTTTPFFSIYLNTLKPRGKKSSGEVFLRKMILQFENFHSEYGYDASSVKKEKAFLEKTLNELTFSQAAGYAVFVNSSQHIYETQQLPYSPSDQFFCQLTANLYPLVRSQHDLENYVAVVLDTRQAKIFTIGLGKIVETKILEKEEFVDVRLKEKLGRYKVYKNKLERKLDLYIENFVEEVLKDVKQKVSDQAGFSFFAGDEVILPVVDKKLSGLKNFEHGFLKIDIKTPASEVLSKSLAGFKKIKKQKRAQILQEFLEHSGSGRKIISGFEKAFENFKNDNILTLIVGLDPGYEICFCPFCWYWEKTIKLKTCPNCNLPLEVVDYKHKLVNLAYRFGVKFHFVEEKPEFKKKEGVGAYLKR